MLVGQALALMLLDPMSIQAAGVVPRAQLMELLDKLLGADNLIFAVNPRRKRRDEKVDHELVRKEIDRALRHLASLGFIDVVQDGQLRLRAPLLRFADPVRDLGAPADSLAKLIGRGQATLLDLDTEDSPDHASDDEEDDQP
jgi:chromosome partition protein MukE